MGELNAAARDPGVISPLEHERRVRHELFSGLIDPPPGHADETCEDQRLRLCPALGEALLDEELIGPSLRRQRSKSQARAGCWAISRPSADKAIATMWRALSSAWSYCACGESWSKKTSGNAIVRILSP